MCGVVLLNIRDVTVPVISELPVQLFRLSRERIWQEISSRLVMTEQADLHKNFVFLVEALLPLFSVSIFAP